MEGRIFIKNLAEKPLCKCGLYLGMVLNFVASISIIPRIAFPTSSRWKIEQPSPQSLNLPFNCVCDQGKFSSYHLSIPWQPQNRRRRATLPWQIPHSLVALDRLNWNKRTKKFNIISITLTKDLALITTSSLLCQVGRWTVNFDQVFRIKL